MTKYKELETILLSGITDVNIITAYTEINVEELSFQLPKFRAKHPVKSVKEARCSIPCQHAARSQGHI